MTGADRLFFVHLQKTAGTALFKRLRRAVGEDAVYPLPSEQGAPEVVLDVERLRRRLSESGEQFRVVTGHFPLATVELLAAELGTVRTFTVLRDPVERVLSFLRHQREVEPRFSGWSLEEIYRDPICTTGLVADHQVRMLSLTPDETTAGALSPVVVDDARVEVALHNLTHRVDVFGIQERFEEFCAELSSVFGLDLGEPLFMNRTSPVDVPDGLRRQIAVDNHHDIRLYEQAVSALDRRRGASSAANRREP